jgi:hypothetical protein
MRVALLSFTGVLVVTGLLQTAVKSVVNLWFPSPPDKPATTAGTVDLLISLAVIAVLIWIVSGTTRARTRERLVTIGFPALFPFVWSVNDSVLQWLGFAVATEQGNGLNYLLTYARPEAAFVQAPLALAATIILGEVLSRRWARLTLLPK